MGEADNLGYLFLNRAQKHPEKTAILSSRRAVSYADLRGAVITFAEHMREHGVTRQSCVAIDSDSAFIAISSALAVALLGARWVGASKVALHRSALGITHVFWQSTKSRPSYFRGGQISRNWLRRPDGIEGKPSFLGNHSGDNVYYYADSSGSTGRTKFMPLTYVQYMSRVDMADGDVGREDVVSVGFFRPTSSLGMRWRIAALLGGGTVVESRDINRWREAGVNEVYGSPTQLASWIRDESPEEGELVSFLKLSGSKTSPELLSHMRRYFENIRVSYGSTEAGRVCTRTLGVDDEYDGCLGPVAPGVEVEVVDESGTVLSAGLQGELRVRAGAMLNGYLDSPKAAARAFRGGWFYPGDLGVLSEDNQLTILGRVNDQLNLGGVKLDATQIDHQIQSLPSIVDAVSFENTSALGTEQLAVIVQAEEGADPKKLAEKIRAYCKKVLGAHVVPKELYFCDETPRNENGKPMRHKAMEMVIELSPL
jgi:acyl-coenzyme A synthetase/AMP-(fatty) acid ligase